jgi:A118 family predicted phage portal protein
MGSEGLSSGETYWVPEYVRDYLRRQGHSTRALAEMEPYVREWNLWMRAEGDFYNYRDTDGFGRLYEVHRRTVMPAMRVCREWGSLLLDEKTTLACSDQSCTDWLESFLLSTNFWGRAQETVVRAFGLGTGAFVLWVDVGRKYIRIRHYDARMVVPLSWDAEGVKECAFVTRAFFKGEAIDQVQMHTVGDDGDYLIRTICFDSEGRELAVPGVAPAVRTGSAQPTFGLVRPAVPNTRVDFSPYGQSVFADAIDAVQSVDLAFDALINEVDAGKMRVFLSDVMFDQRKTADGKRVPIPFGKGDCTVFRKVMSTEDTIQEFAPSLRTDAQAKALRLALQVLGDLCGLGVNYFDPDNVGYVKTATEVSSDNSALMRNIRKNENALAGPLTDVARALLACARNLGKKLPEEGEVSVIFDDSIVQDTDAEKRRDMDEVAAGLMSREEYRTRWYGKAAKA